VDVTALAGLAVAAVVMLAATVLGVWWRRRQGRVRQVAAQPGTPGTGGQLAALGVRPGVTVTLLQFSSAFCAPCRATRLTCVQVADQVDGVRYVEVDAESHLDEVRALGVWRTPTVFVIDTAGRIVSRLTGRPTRDQVLTAVGPLLPQPCGVSGS
jgi:thiol-disulfide isomerase/thioredoxin